MSGPARFGRHVVEVIVVAGVAVALLGRGSSAPEPGGCVPRTRPISGAPAVAVSESVVAGTDGRLERVALRSPAMRADVPMFVLLPAGYASNPRTRYPVLYLLHGAGNDYQAWIQHGVQGIIDRATASDRLRPFITVMADGGRIGFYTDWVGRQAASPPPPPAYATFNIRELIPWVDAHYRTIPNRRARAIAGLSMGGFGAMSLASRYPDRFGAVGSFSGALDMDLDYPALTRRLDGSILDGCMWGDPVSDAINWRAVDPDYLATNLRGLSLFLASGTGVRPRQGGSARVAGGRDAIETLVWRMSRQFARTLRGAGYRYASYFYGPGTHSWPYILRDLRHFLAPMERAFTRPPPAPPEVSFDYRTASSRFTMWGWTFSSDHPAREFTYLNGVGFRGFTVAGSGTLSVTTAPLYAPLRGYRIVIAQAQPLAVRSDRRGRLSFTVTLGPGHRDQQRSFPATGPPAGWHTARVAIDATTGPAG